MREPRQLRLCAAMHLDEWKLSLARIIVLRASRHGANMTGCTGMETMKPMTIGMIDGMSWESSAEYYRLANELVKERLGGWHSARCVLYSVDFAEIEAMQVAGQWDRAGEVLAEAGRCLERAGADVLLLCTNTMHNVADQIVAAVDIPLLDLRDVTAGAIDAVGLHRVGLLATAYTMEQSFYRDRLASHGLDVVVPNPEDRAAVHQIIFAELCLGIVSEQSRSVCKGVIGLVADSCESIILGCTELELLIGASDSPVPIFPTTRLHVEAALDRVLWTEQLC